MQFKANVTKKIIMVIMAFTLLTANMSLPIYAESSVIIPIVTSELPDRGDR